jgi:3'-5' exoribonuclease 1
MKTEKTFVVVDLEATCYKDSIGRPIDFDNEIIEIGAVKLDSNGVEISRFGKFAKPLVYTTLSDFCTELTTIKQKDVDYADDLKDVLVEFFDWAGDSALVSWGNYDKNQLEKDLKRNSLDIEIKEHYSLKHLHGKWNNLRRGGIGISGALRLEGLTFEGTKHRGIDDAINIAKVFRKYLNKF